MHETRIRDFSDDQPETGQGANQLVTCFWCERIHIGKHPLSVCPACAASYSTLRSLEMRGSYPLSDGGIDEALTHTAPGNYALGYMDGDSFTVFYVGRSDSDLRRRLHEWVGMPSNYERYASGAKAAWGGHRRGPFSMDVPMLGRVGNADTRYTHFAYSYSESATAAFEKERRNFEDFGGSGALDNQTEPVSATG